MNQNQIEIRRLFLEEFVSRLIDACTPIEMRPAIEKQVHSPSRIRINPSISRRISVDEQIQALERTFVPLAFSTGENNSLEKINKFSPPAPSRQVREYGALERPAMPVPKPTVRRRPFSLISRPSPKPMPMQKQFSAMGGMEAEKPILIGGDFGFHDSEKMKYVLFLLTDPTVQSIECPGLGKQILLNKSGNLQASNVSLSKEEIDEIIYSISKKTKVPTVPGLFKAAFDNFLITAVISEVAGTRFVIQKVYHPPAPPVIGQTR